MSRRQQTTATFAVRILIPVGGNCQAAQQYIEDAIRGWGGGKSPEDPFFRIEQEHFTVALIKRTTTYGNV